jgi:hypothetical protein
MTMNGTDANLDPVLRERQEIAQLLLARGLDDVDLQMHPELDTLPAALVLTADLAIPFPSGLAPQVTTPDPKTVTTDRLPNADIVVITWTVDEQNALADVLTPGAGRKMWTRYNRNFEQRYASQIRPGAPAGPSPWQLVPHGNRSEEGSLLQV